MSDIKISLDTSGPKGEISVVRVDGVIDTMTSSDLEKVMNSLLERNKYNIIVDLGGVDYISSAGWGIFISNIREIRQHSGDIKLARMIPNVYEIFELLEFDSILKAFDNVEKAKSEFFNAGKSRPGAPTAAPGSPIIGPNPAKLKDVIAASESTGPNALPVSEKIIPPPAVSETRAVPKSLEEIVHDLVMKDPFLSIAEIKAEIVKKNPSSKTNWWQIWNILRKNNMLSKKSRFRRARFKSGDI